MRLPLTIWRFTLVEVWRLLLMSTAVLVVVVAFAVMVKFLATGRLDPADILPFMAVATIPMMQYALPFAAGFAATLAFHRMAQDNEITGALAAGIGRGRLLVPALATGVAVLVLLGALMHLVIPRLLLSMEGFVGERATKVLVRAVERHEPIVFGNRMLWADELSPLKREEGDDAEHMLLLGVVAVELDEAGGIVWEATARMARVSLRSGAGAEWGGEAGEPGAGGETVVSALLFDAEHRDREGTRRFREWSPPAQVVPGAFDDDPKYLDAFALARARREPDRFNFISSRARRLAARVAEREVIDAMARDLGAYGRASLAAPEGDTYAIAAAGVRWRDDRWELLPPPGGQGRVEVERRSGDPAAGSGEITRLAAAGAFLRGEPDAEGRTPEPRLRLELQDVRAFAGEREAGRLRTLRFEGLRLPDRRIAEIPTLPAERLLERLRPRVEGPAPDESLARPFRDLHARIARLRREITSKQHERVAVCLSGLVMVVTGAVKAMRLAGSLPLVVYLWSFLPALAALLTISAGQQMTHQVGAPGLLVLWGGVAGLALHAAAAWRALARR